MPDFVALGCLEVGEKFTVGWVGWWGGGVVGWWGAFIDQLQSYPNLG